MLAGFKIYPPKLCGSNLEDASMLTLFNKLNSSNNLGKVLAGK